MSTAARSFAIIPACGRSRRMGTDKLLLPWNNSTILETVIDAWQQSRVDHIVIVIPKSRADLQKLLAPLPVHLVTADPRPADMKGSVQLALREIETRFTPTPEDVWLVAPADMPTLSTRTVDLVLKAGQKIPGRCVVPKHGDKQGHPVLFPWSMAAEVFHLADDQGLNSLARPDVIVRVAAAELGQDVDTTEQFRALQKENEAPPHSRLFTGRPVVQEEYDRGRRDAERDFANGHGKLFWQTRGSWGRFFFDLMQARYGIYVEHTSDITWDAKLSYEAGYNSVTREHVEAIDGDGEMDRIWEEVQAYRLESYRLYLEQQKESEEPE